jgi:cobalt-zinc-cadmium resistance protein CzcA
MIRTLVDVALRNRLFVLGVAIVVFIWGAISFRNLPGKPIPTSRTTTFR